MYVIWLRQRVEDLETIAEAGTRVTDFLTRLLSFRINKAAKPYMISMEISRRDKGRKSGKQKKG